MSSTTDKGKGKNRVAEKHFIQWIEIITDGKVYHQSLQPGQAPEAVFPLVAENVIAREHCNLHGVWEAKL